MTGRSLKSILKLAKRASCSSRRLAVSRERLCAALSVDAERTFSASEESLASTARGYRPNVVTATQDLNALQARYAGDKR